jgi:hypothetical protein
VRNARTNRVGTCIDTWRNPSQRGKKTHAYFSHFPSFTFFLSQWK